jgi:putative ABC transport system permease protein
VNLFLIAFRSLVNRKVTTGLTVLTIAMSVSLLIGIERIRQGTRQSFESTISGVDLIVGARSGPINLLLYTVFRIGNPTNNVSWKTYQEIASDAKVKWAVPISLGDSHKGYRVIGTTPDYFEHVGYGGGKKIEFEKGQVFTSTFEVVIGSTVAKKLGYHVDQEITLSHGTGEVSFQEHADKRFRIVGILKPTSTPVDQGLLVSLESMEALHMDWDNGAPPLPGKALSQQAVLNRNLTPEAITAFYLGVNKKIALLNLRRSINENPNEALSAIMPGVTLMELWGLLGFVETALFSVSILVFISGLVAMLLALISTLNERRREMAVLRSVGAGQGFIFQLLVFESLLLTVAGATFGTLFTYGLLYCLQPLLEQSLGLALGVLGFGITELSFLATIVLVSVVVGLIPGYFAYKRSLLDGLTVRI